MMPREAVCAAIYGLPDFVTVGGRRYKINTDFRIWARIEKLLTGGDGGADSKRRLAAALTLAYPRLPENAEDAVRGMLWFYSAGRAACEPTAPHCGAEEVTVRGAEQSGKSIKGKCTNGAEQSKETGASCAMRQSTDENGAAAENAAAANRSAEPTGGTEGKNATDCATNTQEKAAECGTAADGSGNGTKTAGDITGTATAGGLVMSNAPYCGGTADGVTADGCVAAPAPARVHSSAHADADKTCRERVRRTAVYDFDEDFEYLWGAFLSEYGIDLAECSMHWWKFRALMMSLSEDCRFSKILAYRSMDTSKIENRKVRRFYEKMKRRLSLPDRRTAEERERDTAECLEVFF